MTDKRRLWAGIAVIGLGLVLVATVPDGLTGRAMGGCGGSYSGPSAGPAQLDESCVSVNCDGTAFPYQLGCDRSLTPHICKLMPGAICSDSADCFSEFACGFHGSTSPIDFEACGGRPDCTCLEAHDDISPPQVGAIAHSPTPPSAGNALEVLAYITDNGRVAEPTLVYAFSGQSTSLLMTPTGESSRYSAWIPAAQVTASRRFSVHVEARDTAYPAHNTVSSPVVNINVPAPCRQKNWTCSGSGTGGTCCGNLPCVAGFCRAAPPSPPASCKASGTTCTRNLSDNREPCCAGLRCIDQGQGHRCRSCAGPGESCANKICCYASDTYATHCDDNVCVYYNTNL